ncbi:MAG: carboxylating nicotinate-nucleotide diphosphorylase [Oscillospiraceae bacterium]|nr:carboxylating nicotinate-nucleotide diphosphorylase [Oscillospiraceae bacterium]
MELLQSYIDRIINTALEEDIHYVDVTSDLLIDPQATSTARWIAKAEGVVCGLKIAARVFTTLDPEAKVELLAEEGAAVKKGDILLTVQGKTAAMLKAERTALNIACHMSGISTQTAECVRRVAGTKASVCDTRKTLPGLRPLQKYAVVMGGGRNHRYNLSDAAMLKDNHIDAYGSITAAVAAFRSRCSHMTKIEVEARNLKELAEGIAAGADVVMLDNMTPAQMAEAVAFADGRVILEASGNITLDNIAEVAASGVDLISLGALTHSVRCFDISMKIVK